MHLGTNRIASDPMANPGAFELVTPERAHLLTLTPKSSNAGVRAFDSKAVRGTSSHVLPEIYVYPSVGAWLNPGEKLGHGPNGLPKS